MREYFYFNILFMGLLSVLVLFAMGQNGQPLVLSDAVLPTSSADPSLDPRVFNPEFYRKLNPGLDLAADQEATQRWMGAGVNHCLRALFKFYSADYLQRYLTSDCRPRRQPRAILRFVSSPGVFAA